MCLKFEAIMFCDTNIAIINDFFKFQEQRFNQEKKVHKFILSVLKHFNFIINNHIAQIRISSVVDEEFSLIYNMSIKQKGIFFFHLLLFVKELSIIYNMLIGLHAMVIDL